MAKFICVLLGFFATMLIIVAIDVAWKMFIALAVGGAWGAL